MVNERGNENGINLTPQVQQSFEPQQMQNDINPLMQILTLLKNKSHKEFDISDVISKLKRNKQIRKGIK